MSKKETLIQRFKSLPRDFTYSQLVTWLGLLGYIEIKTVKSAGSRKAFFHSKTSHIIRLHRPHPGNVLKSYQMKQLFDELKKEDLK